jgi:hypothetical protein
LSKSCGSISISERLPSLLLVLPRASVGFRFRGVRASRPLPLAPSHEMPRMPSGPVGDAAIRATSYRRSACQRYWSSNFSEPRVAEANAAHANIIAQLCATVGETN